MNITIKHILVITILIFSNVLTAGTKTYLLHGYGGFAFEMKGVHKALQDRGAVSEIFPYPSYSQDVDSVACELYTKIKKENLDTVCFVTHSMGALVVRALFGKIVPGDSFPVTHRLVMIAPPNKGTSVADFFIRSKFIRYLAGPNIKNLTTDTLSGASRYPLPSCETGLIIGSYGEGKRVNLFIHRENDGIVATDQAILGNEKDILQFKSWHWGLLYQKKVIDQTLYFLQNGKFQ